MPSVTTADPPPAAETIVRAAGSNLAFALAVLPRARRRDMRVFYAFCRVVDDLADEDDLPDAQKRTALARWRSLVTDAPTAAAPRPGLEQELSELIARHHLPADHLAEIVDGVTMDLDQSRYATLDDLLVYCHRVASAVGLVSIEIFGCQDPSSRVYAKHLGYALQLTNILRDVGEDARRGRIYMPRADLERFGVTEAEILARRPGDGFTALMSYLAGQADRHFAAALAARPESDRRALRSAELMRTIYSRILDKMRADGYRVFEKRYRLDAFEKLGVLLRAIGGALTARR